MSENGSLYYYNPNSLERKEDLLPGIGMFSHYFNIYNQSVAPIDRTGTIKIPLSVTSLFPIPSFRKYARTFEELVNERATELLSRAEQQGVRLSVLYSGGIDSTLVLVSLLKNANKAQKSLITVLLNDDSIRENPNFYREHIRGKLPMDSSTKFPYLLGGPDILVDGELNDQLFGADKIGSFMYRFGSEAASLPYDRGTFFRFFGDSINDKEATERFLDIFERLAMKCPIRPMTNYDHLWWINFSLKWQSVSFRMISYVAGRNVSITDRQYLQSRLAHFYGTDEFQLWSMNNPDKKWKDEWRTYKWICKEIIFEYTKDAEYRDHKTKRWSLNHLIEQRHSYNFITDKMEFCDKIDPLLYCVPDNDFR